MNRNDNSGGTELMPSFYRRPVVPIFGHYEITESAALPVLRKAGWRILVHGWRKNAAGRYVLREIDPS